MQIFKECSRKYKIQKHFDKIVTEIFFLDI